MRVVIDTNVLINCIGARTKHHLIWKAFLLNTITLSASFDMLLEYQELVLQKYPAKVASEIIDVPTDPDYIKQCEIYYYWHAITIDPDDNKFYDAAVSCNADYLVTFDTHFNEAKRLEFPKVNIISADEFLEILKALV